MPLFLLTYWKQIAAVLVVLALLGGVAYIYNSGKQSERARQAREVIHDISKAIAPTSDAERDRVRDKYRRD